MGFIFREHRMANACIPQGQARKGSVLPEGQAACRNVVGGAWGIYEARSAGIEAIANGREAAVAATAIINANIRETLEREKLKRNLRETLDCWPDFNIIKHGKIAS
jgi:hypothetical protein